jgi:EAL domain-containing protein (putative c-di-GMP-specific phosphodiesterase class I)
LEQACGFARRLADGGYGHLTVAVNISPKQLRVEGFAAGVLASVAKAGIAPEQLELEVTESILVESLESSVLYLEQLLDFGIGLALDDFGTGYSSLTYLRHLPVKLVKIDKTFINKSCEDSMQFQLVRSIIQLGHNLGLSLVAEGVESPEKLLLLADLVCDRIQGYVFS